MAAELQPDTTARFSKVFQFPIIQIKVWRDFQKHLSTCIHQVPELLRHLKSLLLCCSNSHVPMFPGQYLQLGAALLCPMKPWQTPASSLSADRRCSHSFTEPQRKSPCLETQVAPYVHARKAKGPEAKAGERHWSAGRVLPWIGSMSQRQQGTALKGHHTDRQGVWAPFYPPWTMEHPKQEGIHKHH